MKASPVILFASASLLTLIAGCMPARWGIAPQVPENLRPPATQRLALEADATGVQIYDCKPAADNPARYEWTFRAPEADLLDPWGRKIGRHYAGPTWESYDGSKVVGEVKARTEASDPNAIPWLLLNARSKSGVGVLGQTASIQRAQTVGGKAPAQGCTPALAGSEVRVAYTAKYYFYEAKR